MAKIFSVVPSPKASLTQCSCTLFHVTRSFSPSGAKYGSAYRKKAESWTKRLSRNDADEPAAVVDVYSLSVAVLNCHNDEYQVILNVMYQQMAYRDDRILYGILHRLFTGGGDDEVAQRS